MRSLSSISIRGNETVLTESSFVDLNEEILLFLTFLLFFDVFEIVVSGKVFVCSSE
jgi:hypothetical protein